MIMLHVFYLHTLLKMKHGVLPFAAESDSVEE